ncbi:MAG: hypothetical protein GY862_29825 [Gammaproteobacteria bacterium]|nr:hypothetical protein [Gammaproteobacteria bacterium]
MSNNFRVAARGLWNWQRRQSLLLKLIAWIWVLPAGLVLTLISWVFKLGWIFDFFARLLRGGRNWALSILNRGARRLQWRKSAYLTVPVTGLVLWPLAILLGLFPKLGADLDAADDPADAFDMDHGFFFALTKSYLLIGWNYLRYSFSQGLFMPVALFLSLFVVPSAWAIALFFAVFILLDWLGVIVEWIRRGVASSSHALAIRAGRNIFFVMVIPVLLVVLFPIYVLLLLIPKVSSYDV